MDAERRLADCDKTLTPDFGLFAYPVSASFLFSGMDFFLIVISFSGFG
jgi:hypothetical protein